MHRTARILHRRGRSGLVSAGHMARHRQAETPHVYSVCQGAELGGSSPPHTLREWRDAGRTACTRLVSFLFFDLRLAGPARWRASALDDFDWRNETFCVHRAKRGGIQQFPIQYEVGEAILDYLRYGRPHCACRNVFLTLQLPYRPLGARSMWSLVGKRMKKLGNPDRASRTPFAPPLVCNPTPEKRSFVEGDRGLSWASDD